MKTKKTDHYRAVVVPVLVLSLLGLALAGLLPAAERAGPEQANPARWQTAIAAFEAADKVHAPPQGAILFIGSSTIVRWNTLARDFPEHRVINRGFGGSQIADSVFYADRIVIPYRPRLIVLRAGGNDIHAGKTPQQVAADFQAFVDKVRAKLPDVRIAYLTINASPSRWANVEREKQANQLIKEYIAQGTNLDYIDTFAATLGADGKPREDLFVKDRLHFNDEGYKILTAIVQTHLK
jgi:lysophospholipase L1-like esterase